MVVRFFGSQKITLVRFFEMGVNRWGPGGGSGGSAGKGSSQEGPRIVASGQMPFRAFSPLFLQKKEITPVRTFRRFSAFSDLSIGRDAKILECVGQRLNERTHIITGDVDGWHVIRCLFAGVWFTPKGGNSPPFGE